MTHSQLKALQAAASELNITIATVRDLAKLQHAFKMIKEN